MLKAFIREHVRSYKCQVSKKKVLLELIRRYYPNLRHKDNKNDYCYWILCDVLSHEYLLILTLIIRRECDSSPSPGWKADLPG